MPCPPFIYLILRDCHVVSLLAMTGITSLPHRSGFPPAREWHVNDFWDCHPCLRRGRLISLLAMTGNV